MTKRVMVQMPISGGMKEVFDTRPDIECDRFTDLSEDNLVEHIANYDAAILGVAPFTPRIIARADRLKVVSRFGVGYDAVNVPALTEAGILLTVVGTANSVTVAEHSLFLILALAKRCTIYDREVRKGNWNIRWDYHRLRHRRPKGARAWLWSHRTSLGAPAGGDADGRSRARSLCYPGRHHLRWRHACRRLASGVAGDRFSVGELSQKRRDHGYGRGG